MIYAIPAFNDNYIWILVKEQQAIIIDPGQDKPVIEFLTQQQLTPTAILLTHHHNDHIGGVAELQKEYPNIRVFGPNEIKLPCTHINEQSQLTQLGLSFKIIEVPGHTLGHIAYYIPSLGVLFCGDTLFSGGCGRIFEGTYEQMFHSINKLKELPENTMLYPAHEYTKSNIKFSLHLLPEDKEINGYWSEIENKRITLPTSLKKEKKINLFLQTEKTELQKKFNVNNELELFTYFRSQKDNF